MVVSISSTQGRFGTAMLVYYGRRKVGLADYRLVQLLDISRYKLT